MDPTTLSIILKAAVIHTVTYGVVGSLAYWAFNYPRLFVTSELRFVMRPTSDWRVKTALLIQPVRGAIFGFAFVLLRRPYLDEPRGWLTMWIVLVLLSVVSSFGPTTTSIEGMLFTKIPMRLHVVGLPEILTQSLLLSFLVYTWVKHPDLLWLSLSMWTLFIVAIVVPLLGLAAQKGTKQRKTAESGNRG